MTDDRLAAAIARVHRTFARYLLRGSIEVCRCRFCVTREVEAELIGMPPEELSAEVLAAYTISAHGMSRSIAHEFRSLLPRYLVLIAAGDWPSYHGPENCLQRLRDADWRRTWPDDEVSALDEYFLALLESVLRGGSVPGRALFTEFFEMLVRAGCDLGALLDLWDSTETPASALFVAELLEEYIFPRYADLIGAKWNPRWAAFATRLGQEEEADRRLEAWLVRSKTLARLERTFFMTTDREVQERLSTAHLALSDVLSFKTLGG